MKRSAASYTPLTRSYSTGKLEAPGSLQIQDTRTTLGRQVCSLSRILLVLLGVCGNLHVAGVADAAEETHVQEPVIVELFTSQGCSSCPPADRLLSKIATWSDQHQTPVYCLSFHVDYWNYLGWTDPYSDRQFSERQRTYASAFKSRRVYTPQMIVGGQTEFVGMRSADAQKAINKGLETKSESTVSLTLKRSPDGKRHQVEYVVRGADPDSVLNIALVQREAKNEVPKGENAGKDLAHANVVRSFQTVALVRPSGQIEMLLPQGMDIDSARIIAYVQNRRTMKIRGATAKDF